MKNAMKQILRAVSGMPSPAVTESHYAEFFRHPCWVALRHEAAKRLDAAADQAFSSEDLNEICKMRGVMQGLMFVLQGQDYIKHIITDNMDAVSASPSIEKRIEDVLNLMEREQSWTKTKDSPR